MSARMEGADRRRADLGFGADLGADLGADAAAERRGALAGFDPADWAPAAPLRPAPPAATARGAGAAGFHPRPAPQAGGRDGQGGRNGWGGQGAALHSEPRAEPQSEPQSEPRPERRPDRRRRTGRNAQLNLKLRPDTIDRFCAVADAHGWGLGETFERALALLEEAERRHG